MTKWSKLKVASLAAMSTLPVLLLGCSMGDVLQRVYLYVAIANIFD